MDDKTLASLRAALDASPENSELRMVLVGAYLERDDAGAAHELVRDLSPPAFAADQRRLAAGACLEVGDPEAALTWAGGDSPEDDDDGETLLVKERALLALELQADGLA